VPDHTRHSQDSSRRGWVVALSFAVLVHVILIGALIIKTRGSDSSADTVRDVPIMRGVLGDTGAVLGVAPPPSRPLIVSCTYIVEEVARLSSGPPFEPGELSCKNTLNLPARAAWNGDIEASYNSDGELIGINGRPIQPRDPLAVLVQGWDLATPRPGRQWPGQPTITIRKEEQR
jgi:hypothetical protein